MFFNSRSTGDISIDKTPKQSNASAPEAQAESCRDVVYLLGMQGIASFILYGFLPSIQSYSCLPYGTTAYHLAVTLSNIANPVLCCVLLVPTVPKPKTCMSSFAATVLGVLFSCYVTVTALMSPLPPLLGTIEGQVILVSLAYAQFIIYHIEAYKCFKIQHFFSIPRY